MLSLEVSPISSSRREAPIHGWLVRGANGQSLTHPASRNEAAELKKEQRSGDPQGLENMAMFLLNPTSILPEHVTTMSRIQTLYKCQLPQLRMQKLCFQRPLQMLPNRKAELKPHRTQEGGAIHLGDWPQGTLTTAQDSKGEARTPQLLSTQPHLSPNSFHGPRPC